MQNEHRPLAFVMRSPHHEIIHAVVVQVPHACNRGAKPVRVCQSQAHARGHVENVNRAVRVYECVSGGGVGGGRYGIRGGPRTPGVYGTHRELVCCAVTEARDRGSNGLISGILRAPWLAAVRPILHHIVRNRGGAGNGGGGP